MFGKRSCDLLRSVARCSPEAIPAYNDEGVRLVLEEIQLHNDALVSIMKSVEEIERQRQAGETSQDTQQQLIPDWSRYSEEASAVLVHHDSILRNKRVMWTYMSIRLKLIRDLRWHSRSVSPHIQKNLSQAEMQYFTGYDRLLSTGGGTSSYPGYTSCTNLGVGIDLTLGQTPPKGYCVTVKVIRDYGDVAFSVGILGLAAGSVHILQHEEAEPLIQSGVLVNFDDYA